jgi:hypothetical protein
MKLLPHPEILNLPYPEEPERSEGVSKDGAAPWFETRLRRSSP